MTVAASTGLADLTIAEVARAAGVSSALVHYHFDTKQALMVAAADRAATQDSAALREGLGTGRGLRTLDRLWEVVLARSSSGRAAFALEIRLRSSRSPDLVAAVSAGTRGAAEAVTARLPELLRELDSRLAEPREEITAAVLVFLDGLALALAAGRPAEEVRAAYDAFWLALIAAGQDGRRR
jgi:AcrR family transcriptional regulator